MWGQELITLLASFEYQLTKGKGTGGSRRRFMHTRARVPLTLHQPHQGNSVKKYVLRDVKKHLRTQGLI